MKSFLLFTAFILIAAIDLSGQTKSIIHFNSNKSDLNSNAKKTLDSIVSVVNNSSSYKISIHGYCDNTGNEAINQPLSEERAKVIFNYFKNKNLNAGVISFQGFSSTDAIAENTTEDGKLKNRRAEIEIQSQNASELLLNTGINEVKQAPEEVENPVKPKGSASFSANTNADNLEVGKKLILKNMNFEGGTAVMLEQSGPTLKALLKMLKENESVEIEIDGHVCCANDMPLSIERAQAVMNFLIRNGIDKKRLSNKGFSNLFPITNEENEYDRMQNRRVEILVLKK